MGTTDQKVSKNMTFGELLRAYPNAAAILSSYGLHCVGCRMNTSETIEQGMRAHGLDDAKLEELIKEINASIA